MVDSGEVVKKIEVYCYCVLSIKNISHNRAMQKYENILADLLQRQSASLGQLTQAINDCEILQQKAKPIEGLHEVEEKKPHGAEKETEEMKMIGELLIVEQKQKKNEGKESRNYNWEAEFTENQFRLNKINEENADHIADKERTQMQQVRAQLKATKMADKNIEKPQKQAQNQVKNKQVEIQSLLPQPKLGLVPGRKNLNKYDEQGSSDYKIDGFAEQQEEKSNQFSGIDMVVTQQRVKKDSQMKQQSAALSLATNYGEKCLEIQSDMIKNRRPEDLRKLTGSNFNQARLKKNSKILVRNRLTIKSQFDFSEDYSNQKQAGLSTGNLQPFTQKIPSNKMRRAVNFSINSNVVSYCQSLSESKDFVTNPEEKAYSNKKINLSEHQNSLNPGHAFSRNRNSRNSKLKTEESQPQSCSRKKYYTEIQNQLEAKLHLKVIYEKKKKLHEKLKRLNRELEKISTSEEKTLQTRQNMQNPVHFMKNQQKSQNRTQRLQSLLNVRHAHSKVLVNSLSLSRQNQDLSQLQTSKKAIDFISKVSKQSLKRRMTHHKKINAQVYERAKQHVCLNCSRTKCKQQVLQCQIKQQRRRQGLWVQQGR